MAQDQTLVAEKRTKTGTSECRRLRRQGQIPGNLYGHGQDPVMFSVQMGSVDILDSQPLTGPEGSMSLMDSIEGSIMMVALLRAPTEVTVS